ncbi:MAG: hypothetical protein U0694_10290 [Anaerolineae bacterium]
MKTTLDYRQLLEYAVPPLISGGITLLLFMFVGHTPFVRAFGLALVIAAMTLTLRRMGLWLSVIGGLALAFSPAFWSQNSDTPSGAPVMALVLGATIGCALLVRRFGTRALIVVEIALLIGAIIFWRDFTYYKSLRITTLCAALVLFTLMDGLLRTNPRPDEAPRTPLDELHMMVLLLLFSVGIINDPLFGLFAPAIVLGLLMSRTKLPLWYWGLFVVILGVGLYNLANDPVRSHWWTSSPVQSADASYIVTDAWRDSQRWIMLIQLVVSQFTPIGAVLGVLGLARLARWYPPLGLVTMVAYAAYTFFGLIYFGIDSAVLLLPLLMIQVLWMTYAVFTFSTWLQKAFKQPSVRWLAPAAFTLMPLAMLLHITGVW